MNSFVLLYFAWTLAHSHTVTCAEFFPFKAEGTEDNFDAESPMVCFGFLFLSIIFKVFVFVLFFSFIYISCQVPDSSFLLCLNAPMNVFAGADDCVYGSSRGNEDMGKLLDGGKCQCSLSFVNFLVYLFIFVYCVLFVYMHIFLIAVAANVFISTFHTFQTIFFFSFAIDIY